MLYWYLLLKNDLQNQVSIFILKFSGKGHE